MQCLLLGLRWCILILPLALLAALAAPSTGHTANTEATAMAVVLAGYTETIPDSNVHFDLVAIPGGTLRMGSPEEEKGRGPDEGPQHLLRIQPFWMGKTEVTWDEYNQFNRLPPNPPKAGQSEADKKADAISRPTPSFPDEYRGFGKKGYPVVGMSHHAAMEYCRWLSAKTGKQYRLPTEAEWEYACRAGTKTAYSFGNDPSLLGDYAWFAKNAAESTHPVGNKKPNPWGLYDMYGNVTEWCLDHYRKDYYATFPLDQLTLGPVKPPGPAHYSHVVRGGCWADRAAQCRSATRRGSDKSWNRIDPGHGIWWLWNADFVGFRVVRAVEEQDDLKALRSLVTRESK